MKNIVTFILFITVSASFSCSNVAKKTVQSDSVAAYNTSENQEVVKDPAIYFKATGTEPFWGLEISTERIVLDLVGDSVIASGVEPIVAMDANVKMYRVKTDELTLNIQILQKECENGMSGKISPYTVNIEYKRATDDQSRNLVGCGSYVTDKNLMRNWSLRKLNDKDIIANSEVGNEPKLVIGKDHKFSGFTGCNQMNGDVFFEKGLLRFSNIATTRKFCSKDNVEQEFIKTLKSVTTYKIENNRLILSNQNKQSLTFNASN